ncbi:hypothetical protein Stube_54950 [Streptomyces tubercidicus]|uniref:Uncharacterized protein n=1 Tax=Streptomyces tubercidicus TaxID=47759 RepID=A0A640UZU6_9ACTN|nr:hypothetical protein Stube_54950 [Streptomyces tubercidicus]
MGHRRLGGECADHDASGILTGLHLGDMAQVGHGFRDGTSLWQQGLPGRGEFYGTTGAFDQSDTQPPLQNADLLAECRLRHEEPGGGPAEM